MPGVPDLNMPLIPGISMRTIGEFPADKINLTALNGMSDKEIRKLFNIKPTTSKPTTSNTTPTPTTSQIRNTTFEPPVNLKPIKCHCSICRKQNYTCISYNGCQSSIRYNRQNGKKVDEWYGCLSGGPKEFDSWHAASFCGTPHAPTLRVPGRIFTFTLGKYPESAQCVPSRCCYGDYCNNIPPNFNKECNLPPPSPSIPDNSLNIAVSIIVPIAGFLCLIFALIFGFKFWKRKKLKNVKTKEERYDLTTLTAIPLSDDSLRLLHVDQSCMSSGSGLPFLVQSTVANQIEFKDLIGKGRYGEVWRGTWQSDSIAVKIFNSRDEESWKRETSIYNTVLLRHDNILGYIGSDIATRNGVTCMLLITHFHFYGALYDYINTHTLDLRQMLIFAHSAINGLAHLHSEIAGSTGKPSIAHRDIKTKNILVKKNGECCISDLGLAVLLQKSDTDYKGQVDINSSNYRVGTKRYMAPEVLDETISKDIFTAFTNADIYSFGLVMWEIIRRTHLNGIVEEYQPPYFDVLPSDPPFDHVKKVVKDDCYRPLISKHWLQNKLTARFVNVMKECWADSPRARLSSLRVKKTLATLLTEFTISSDPNHQFNSDAGKQPDSVNINNFCDNTYFTYKSNNTTSGGTFSTNIPESVSITVCNGANQQPLNSSLTISADEF